MERSNLRSLVLFVAIVACVAACSASSISAPECPAGTHAVNPGDSVGYLVYHPLGAPDGVRDTVALRALNHSCR